MVLYSNYRSILGTEMTFNTQPDQDQKFDKNKKLFFIQEAYKPLHVFYFDFHAPRVLKKKIIPFLN